MFGLFGDRALYKDLTEPARRAMTLAEEEARSLNHEFIGTEHILLGLVKEGEGVGAQALNALELPVERLRAEFAKLVRPGGQPVRASKLGLTPRAKNTLQHAHDEARRLNHSQVGTEHLLLAVLDEKDGVGAAILRNMGLSMEAIRQEVMVLLGVDDGLTRHQAELSSLWGEETHAAAEIQKLLMQLDREHGRCITEWNKAQEARDPVRETRLVQELEMVQSHKKELGAVLSQLQQRMKQILEEIRRFASGA